MKKLITSILIVFALCIPGSASDGGAQFKKFGPFFDNAGALERGIRINVFAAGTTTNKTYWTDEGKTTAGAFPLVDTDNDGIVVAYFDGDYRFQVKGSDTFDLDVVIDWDNVKLTSDTSTMWEGNQGTATPAAAAKNKGQIFLLLDASDNLIDFAVNMGAKFASLFFNEVSADWFASFNAAVTAMGTDTKTLVVPTVQTVALNTTVPSNVTLRFTGDGGRLDPNSGVTVTINGPMEAPLRQVFGGAGTIVFTANRALREVYILWWGALGDDLTDNLTILQIIIDAAATAPEGMSVVVNPGKFRASGNIFLRSNVWLVGSGPGAELILTQNTCHGTFINVGSASNVKVLNLTVTGIVGLPDGDNGIAVYQQSNACGEVAGAISEDIEIAGNIISGFPGAPGTGGKTITAQFGVKNVHIHHNLGKNSGIGISVGGRTANRTTGVVVNNNIFRDCDKIGFLAVRDESPPTDDATILDVLADSNEFINCNNNSGFGVITSDRGHNISFTNNKISGTAIAAFRGSFWHWDILGNTINVTATNWGNFNVMTGGGTVSPVLGSTFSGNRWGGIISGDGFTLAASSRLTESVFVAEVLERDNLTGALFNIAMDNSNLLQFIDRDTGAMVWGTGADALNLTFVDQPRFMRRVVVSGAGASLVIGAAGAPILKHLSATATLDFDLTAAVSHDLTITVTGAALNDTVEIGVPNGSVTADTLFFGWVSAVDTVTVRAARLAGTPNPASGTFRVDVWQH